MNAAIQKLITDTLKLRYVNIRKELFFTESKKEILFQNKAGFVSQYAHPAQGNLIFINEGDRYQFQDITLQQFMESKLRFKTRKYLTSGGKQYVPDGRPGQHSPFARKFLEALRSYGGRDHVLTLGELVSYVEVISPEPKFGDFPGDEPGSDFLFVAKK